MLFLSSNKTDIVQYSIGSKISISSSLSQIILKATDCTRPAERLPGILCHRIGKSQNQLNNLKRL